MIETTTQQQPSKKERKKEKNGVKKPDGKNSKEHARMVEAFWKLSEFNQNTRLDGIQVIVKYFNDLEPSKDTENFNYVLKRLVKGLASNRKCSRIGFSACLTELINMNKNITFQSLFDMAKSNLKPSDTDLTKEEIRHMQIGLVFVYLCYIQSTRFETSNDQELTSLLRELNEFRKKSDFKTYTQQIYLQAECLLIRKLSKINKFDLVLNELGHDLQEAFKLSESSNKNLKDSLNLLFVCLNSAEEKTKKVLNEKNLKLKNLLNSKNFDFLYELLSQSTESLPSLAPILTDLFDFLTKREELFFKQFWSSLIEAKLSTRKELEKKFLSLKLFLYSLNLVNTDNYRCIFYDCLLNSENVMQIYVLNLTNRMSNLNELFRGEISRSLIETIKLKESELGQTDSTLGADMIIKILSYTKNYSDVSDLVGSIISVLNKKSQNKIFEFLINDFLSKEIVEFKSSVYEDEAEKETDRDHVILKELWVLNQVNHLAKTSLNYEDNLNLIEKILYYLSINSYFENNGKKLDKFETGISLVKSEKLINNLRERLVEFIGVILYKQNNNQLDSTQLLIGLCESIRDLMNGKKGVKLNEKLVSKEKDLSASTTRILDLLKNLNKKSLDHQEPEQQINKIVYQSFFMCVIIEFFRMFDSIKTTKQTLDDIEICVQKFDDELNSKNEKKSKNKKSKKKSSDDEDEDFEWIDVLVEMLLNLFTINTSTIRKTVKNQFRKLIPKLSVNSVKLIVELLNPENDEDLIADEDDEEMDDDEEIIDDENVDSTEELEEEMIKGDLFLSKKSEEEESGIEDVSMSPSSDKNEKKKQDDDQEDSDESDESDSEENTQVDEELKNNLLKALGNAVANENTEENSDLDDDAMMKLDETIAAAFKMKKKDKQRQNELSQYKLRVLDLIEEIFKSTNRLDLIAYLIRPLLEILFESQTKPNLKLVSQRILGFLMNIKQTTKKIQESKLPELDDLFELLSHLLECSAVHFNVTNTLVETSLFCVRLIQHLAHVDKTQTEKIIKKLTNIYLEIIKNEKSKVNPVMYKEYMVRYAAYSVPIIVQMVDIASQSDVKLHKKTMTLVTLNQCVNAQMFQADLVDEKDSTQMLEKIFKFFNQIVDNILKDENLLIKFVDAFLNLASRVLNLPKSVLRNDLLENFASKLTLVSKDSKLKQAYKNRLVTLIQNCNRHLNSGKNNK
ncbi:unnamed protein product [Brachionus calyciflorus]|uniref:DNA polymerase V n=1 Tax=Brachionus calyciflorus TaxID=104777 RepID=A0A814EW68_9BILA|nr:unnamed protein product [Brachionus calyciflorus]